MTTVTAQPARSELTRKIVAGLLPLIAGGNTNAAIARRYNVPEDTIKRCCRILFRQLGARDRAHAVSIAYQGGLLPVDNQQQRNLRAAIAAYDERPAGVVPHPAYRVIQEARALLARGGEQRG